MSEALAALLEALGSALLRLSDRVATRSCGRAGCSCRDKLRAARALNRLADAAAENDELWPAVARLLREVRARMGRPFPGAPTRLDIN